MPVTRGGANSYPDPAGRENSVPVDSTTEGQSVVAMSGSNQLLLGGASKAVTSDSSFLKNTGKFDGSNWCCVTFLLHN